MSGKPSFQFYPKDWRTDANLRRCTPAARGVWLDIMCVLHDSDEYGLVRYPLKELAGAASAAMGHVRELVDKGVLRGVETGECEPCIFVPRHGRRDGPPVTLVPTQPGPVWYSKRMVKDEYVRTIRGEGTRFGDSPDHAPMPPFGDGSSSSSSSSSPYPSRNSSGDSPPPAGGEDQPPLDLTDQEQGSKLPTCPHLTVLKLWAEVLPALPQHDPEQWHDVRRKHLQTRWRETAAAKGWKSQEDGLAFFRRLFAYVGKSAFLTGRGKADPNRPPFVIELEWLVLPSNWAKVIEGKYHPET